MSADGPNGFCSERCDARYHALEVRIAELEATKLEVHAKLPPDGIPLPVEPIYDLVTAAELIPCSAKSLETFLWRTPAGKAMIPRYRFVRNRRAKRYRMLLASEVAAIRNAMVRRHAKLAA